MAGDPDQWLAQIKECRYLPESDIKALCEKANISIEKSKNNYMAIYYIIVLLNN